MSQKSASVSKSSSKSAPSKGGSGKSKGSYLARQAKAGKRVVTEAELLKQQQPITPEDVLALDAATTCKRAYMYARQKGTK